MLSGLFNKKAWFWQRGRINLKQFSWKRRMQAVHRMDYENCSEMLFWARKKFLFVHGKRASHTDSFRAPDLTFWSESSRCPVFLVIPYLPETVVREHAKIISWVVDCTAGTNTAISIYRWLCPEPGTVNPAFKNFSHDLLAGWLW